MAKKTGRPRKEIEREQFEKLCGLQCTLSEIASYFDCSEDTIERWCVREYEMSFAEVFRVKRESGRISLRRAQFRLAEKKPSMAIWLGKQYLGQKDQQEVRVSADDDSIREMNEYFDRKMNGAKDE